MSGTRSEVNVLLSTVSAAFRSSHPDFAAKLPVAAFLAADGPPLP